MSWYKNLFVGIASLAIASCNASQTGQSKGIEDRLKTTVFQEKEVLPIPEKEDFPFPSQYRPDMSNQFKFLTSNGEYFCTGIFINPEQILTANHCLNTKPENLSVWTFLQGGYSLKGNVSSVVKNPQADFAVITLRDRLIGIHSLQFYSGEIAPDMSISLLTYDGLKQVLRHGKITDVYVEKGYEKFTTNISSIGGNSGGVYLEPSTGKIMGVITHGNENVSLGPSVNNFKVLSRDRELDPKERDIVKIRQQIREAKDIMVGIDYQHFASGKVYLDAHGMICQKEKFIPLVDRCFPREEAVNIIGVKSVFTAVNGIGTLEYTVSFKDGRTYHHQMPYKDSSFKASPGTRTMGTYITISGEGVSIF